MFIIKLDAIDSTNDYLKKISKENEMENFSIVMANEQTKGKGQMGAKWFSEPGKNLILSVLVKDLAIDSFSVFDINVAVALAAADTIIEKGIPNVKIKWPNDIMAESKKVGGILIENNFKPDGTFTAVVGFGLNLNQTDFIHLPQASSLACIMNKTFNSEEIAIQFVEILKKQIARLSESVEEVWKDYLARLFKINEVAAFEDKFGKRFMGIIKGVTRDGKVSVLLKDDTISYFEVKEIKMLF